ncbi:hypothetical protein [Streptomyces sp. HUAS TT7]|uniref:hypothetical protein n=1 Tax=Streptomyces sp. HUAS TT7 TaxID=3447507 RepID=UPI003F65ABCD
MEVQQLMESLGRSGVNVLLKVDEEKMSQDDETWTVFMSGPALGEGEYIHLERSSFDEGLSEALSKLSESPGDWEWVPAHSTISDVTGIESLLESLGRAGVTSILKVDSERIMKDGNAWTISLGGSALGEFEYIRYDCPTLAECLESTFVRLRKFPGKWEWLPELS